MTAELIAENLSRIEVRVAQAAQKAGRDPKGITICAASKRQPLDRIAAYSELVRRKGGVPILGENYVQEYAKKKSKLGSPLEVHLIGALQSNKASLALALFDVIQSVHSEKLLRILSNEAEKAGKTLPIFLQVNVSRDPAKSGVPPEKLPALLSLAVKLPALRVRGLMTITELYTDKELARRDYAALRTLAESLDASLELSMGMSDDFEIAIEEGATCVRIGTALFGARQ